MGKVTKKEPEVLSFKSPNAFERWLKRNHSREEGVWLRLFKKDSGEKAITYTEAIDEALCYGWIDGLKKKYDEQSWIQKFTPRRTGSLWSKQNRERAERLIAEGRVKPQGLAEVERAKANGRWDSAYDSPGNMTMPDDFLKLLSKFKRAKAFFDTLNKANRYTIAWRIQTAKKPETRKKRMIAILEMLKKKEKFH